MQKIWKGSGPGPVVEGRDSLLKGLGVRIQARDTGCIF